MHVTKGVQKWYNSKINTNFRQVTSASASNARLARDIYKELDEIESVILEVSVMTMGYTVEGRQVEEARER